MIEAEYNIVGTGYNDTSNIPKEMDILYRCAKCGGMIPSIPNENIGCACGNIFIDKDCWRLVVEDFSKFEVVRKKSS